MQNQLTIIIPFLNEGDEVLSTVRSIRENGGEHVTVIVINDASDDAYDYEKALTGQRVVYIKNQDRLGVAASRDKGVNIAATPYFLLLDAHMRFYDDNWLKIITQTLEENDRRLLCCQTKNLRKKGEQIYEEEGWPAYGAFLLFQGTDYLPGIKWNPYEADVQADREAVPCVLGAAYAASKRYWQYLRGLEGLMHYGSDEAYISLKVWLEGGRCELLKQVTIGHVYRDEPPYTIQTNKCIYNQLLIATLLFPTSLRCQAFASAEAADYTLFQEACMLLQDRKMQIEELRKYYANILTEKFSSFLLMNNRLMPAKKREIEAEKDRLPQIVQYGLKYSATIPDPGLYKGKAGWMLFFCLYARYSEQDEYDKKASELWNELCHSIHGQLPVCFDTGICGIGWCIVYLQENGAIEDDIESLVHIIDKKVMERDPLRIDDWSLKSGLSGILCYVLCRLGSTARQGKTTFFDPRYFSDLETAARRLLGSCDDPVCRSLANQYLAYFTDPFWELLPPKLTDFMEYPETLSQNERYWKPDLTDGCLGYGLMLMEYLDK